MNHCYFDKKGFWHQCDNPELQGDCNGCKYEHVIASTYYSLCHWCGTEIEHRHVRYFCSKQHQNDWKSARMSYENEEAINGDMYWSSDKGADPVFTIEDIRKIQIIMLGRSRV